MDRNEKKMKKKFFQSLKVGIGKAYLIQSENSGINFSKEIIKGAVRNYAYDQQCEGSRAKYIYKLIIQAANSEQIEKAVLKRLLIERDDWYNLDQMFDLAVLFHKNGNKKAKKVLEKRFQMNTAEEEFVGEKQLIAVNKVAGVLQVADLAGKRLMKDEEDYETSWLVDSFQKKNKKIDVYGILKEEAQRNVNVHKYLYSILEHKIQPGKKIKVKRCTYEEVKRKIEDNRLMVITEKRANELSKKEVRKLAKDFLQEEDKLIREKYLRFFSSRKYPDDMEELLDIVSKPNPPKTRLVEFAAESLKYFRSDQVRAVGLRKIQSTKNPANYLPLLASNYEAGDSKLLLDVINRSKNQDFIHSLVYGLIVIYTFNKTKDCKAPLMKMYKSMACGIHRNDILRIMHQNGVLEKAVLDELKYDSYKDNRKLFKKIRSRN